jgi:hypothetical protein
VRLNTQNNQKHVIVPTFFVRKIATFLLMRWYAVSSRADSEGSAQPGLTPVN